MVSLGKGDSVCQAEARAWGAEPLLLYEECPGKASRHLTTGSESARQMSGKGIWDACTAGAKAQRPLRKNKPQ